MTASMKAPDTILPMSDNDLHSLSERYSHLSEPELMDIARTYDELTEPAQAILREEFRQRGLEPPLIEETVESIVEARSLVTIRSYRDLPEAFVARAILQEAGIPCFLRDEYTVGMQWSLSNALGGTRLQVSEEDAEAANEILSQPIPPSFEIDSGADFEQPVCPKCGSLDVMANDTDRKIKLASTLVGGLPMLIGLPALALQQPNVLKCNACGCRWTGDGEPTPPVTEPLR
jgi:hypothetical protein